MLPTQSMYWPLSTSNIITSNLKMIQHSKAKTVPVCLTEGMLESGHMAPVVLTSTKWQS